jgi:hypothetical protein
MLLGLLLLGLGGTHFAATLYYQVARQSTWHSDIPRADGASKAASALGQFGAPAFSGRIAAVRRDDATLLERFRQTLRDAPSDPYRWTEFALALAWNGDFGPRFDLAISQAQRLAPHSPAVHLALADARWRYAVLLSPAQLDALQPSLTRTMQHLGQRQKMLDHLVRARRHPAFCAEHAALFTGGRWCARIDSELAACSRPEKLDAHKRRWCRRVEALP